LFSAIFAVWTIRVTEKLTMQFVRCSADGAIFNITLDRPEKRNAVHGPMAKELQQAFQQFEDDSTLRVAILTGSGGHFCAGADLSSVSDPNLRNELDPEGGGSGPMGPHAWHCQSP
jgi:enoyl-CoA hydratase